MSKRTWKKSWRKRPQSCKEPKKDTRTWWQSNQPSWKNTKGSKKSWQDCNKFTSWNIVIWITCKTSWSCSIRLSKKSWERQRRRCKRSELSSKTSRLKTSRRKTNWTKDCLSQKKSEHSQETRIETVQTATTSCQTTKNEKECMKIQNKRASHKKRNQEKNWRTKKMMTRTATAIFDDLEDEIDA